MTVNTAGQIMQVHDGGVASIIEAYANGAPAAFTPDHGNGRYTYDVNVPNFDLTADVVSILWQLGTSAYWPCHAACLSPKTSPMYPMTWSQI